MYNYASVLDNFPVMTATPTKDKVTQGTGTGSGGDWNVIVHNTEHNTFEEVTGGLKSVCNLSRAEAESKTWEIHNQGKAIVKTTPKEHAEMYKDQLEGWGQGLTVSIEQN